MKFIFLFSVLFLLTSAVHAQTGLRGTVKTATGEPLPYAAIVVKGADATRPQGTITNVEGRYDIALTPGQYTPSPFSFWGSRRCRKP